MNKKKTIICLVLSFLFTLIISLLIVYKFLYPTVVPMIKNESINLFGDWSAVTSAIKCFNTGFYDVYLENPCDKWGRKFVYGKILLYLPLLENNKYIYPVIIPLLFNFAFIFTITSFFNYEKKSDYLFITFILLSFPILLAIERANIDIFIFLLFFLLSISNNFLINHFIVLFAALIKFYPITSISIFLFNQKISKSIINILFSLLIIFLLLFLQKDEIIKILENKNQFTSHGIYNFSFQYFFSLIYKIQLSAQNMNLNFVKYTFVILFLAILTVKNYRRFKNSLIRNYYKNFSITNYQDKLFILCSTVLIFCYFLFDNYAYREIFFVGLIPFLLKQIENGIDKKYFNFFLNFILIKLIISTFLTIFVKEKIFYDFYLFYLLLKYFLDFILVTMVSLNLIVIFYSFYNKKILKKNNY